jgi:hypothetical protein
MMNAANVPKKFCYMLWRETFRTTMMLDGLAVIKINGISDTRYVHCGNCNPKFAKQLQTWGEAGTVKLKNKRAVKIDDRGYTCMFVGYPASHASNTYRMWDPRSNHVHITRDIIWLQKMFFNKSEVIPMELAVYSNHIEQNLAVAPADYNGELGSNEDIEDINKEINEDSEGYEDNNSDKGGESNKQKGKNNSGNDSNEVITTQLGRIVRPPVRYCEFLDKVMMIVNNNLIGSTKELHVKNYKTAMQSKEKEQWE